MFKLCRLFLLAASILTVADANAQPASWHNFDSKQSRLHFYAPGLDRFPSEAKELYGDPSTKGTRQFLYAWNDQNGQRSGAIVRVGVINQEYTFFPAVGIHQVREFVTEAAKQFSPSFNAGEPQLTDTKIGKLMFQRFSLQSASRHCVSFGGAFGGVHFSSASNSGVTPSGDKFLIGLYCAPQNERMTDSDITVVLEGIGFDEMKPSEELLVRAKSHRFSK